MGVSIGREKVVSVIIGPTEGIGSLASRTLSLARTAPRGQFATILPSKLSGLLPVGATHTVATLIIVLVFAAHIRLVHIFFLVIGVGDDIRSAVARVVGGSLPLVGLAVCAAVLA